ncbi:stealth family protein [Luedemannella helvata]|uniref:Stealth family protein n=1 Tax=Luedemannella helvata TaxID=349315 RepID=A0ABN2JR94_9ACTN
MPWGILSELALFVFRLLPRRPRRWLREQFSRQRQQWIVRQVFRQRRARRSPVGATRRCWEGGLPVSARVVTDVSPIELRRRTFDEVTAVLDAAGVTWFGVPNDDLRSVVAVRSPQPLKLLRVLGEAPELAGATVEAIHPPRRSRRRFGRLRARPDRPAGRDAGAALAAAVGPEPMAAPRGRSAGPLAAVLSYLGFGRAAGRIIGARVYFPATDPTGSWLLGAAYACEIEFWGRDETRLLAPRPNPMGTTLPITDQTVVAPEWVLNGHVPTSPQAPKVRTRAALARIPVDRITFPIDAVYTWVDGADPDWQERKAVALAGLSSGLLHSSAAGESRFTDHGELRYSLRSLSYFAPWLRRIYLVTDGQLPEWLDQSHPAITVVGHREIFGSTGILPTFNSHAIEARLHRIAGLAEHVIYLNDDMFLGRHVAPTTFFHANGVAKFFPGAGHVGLGPASAQDPPADAAGKNNAEVIAQRFGRTVSGRLRRVPYPLQRSVLEEIEALVPDPVRATAAHPFRHPQDLAIPSALQHYWAFLNGRAVPGQIADGYADIADPYTPVLLARWLRRRDRDVFCLDDTGADPSGIVQQEQMLADFLEAYFPFPAPFERLPDGPERRTRPEVEPAGPSPIPGTRRAVVYDRPPRLDRPEPQPADDTLF